MGRKTNLELPYYWTKDFFPCSSTRASGFLWNSTGRPSSPNLSPQQCSYMCQPTFNTSPLLETPPWCPLGLISCHSTNASSQTFIKLSFAFTTQMKIWLCLAYMPSPCGSHKGRPNHLLSGLCQHCMPVSPWLLSLLPGPQLSCNIYLREPSACTPSAPHADILVLPSPTCVTLSLFALLLSSFSGP